MKKLIVFLLALCMVFALCACGSKPTEETSPAEEAALVEDTVKPVTIRFATNKSASEVMCEGFEAFKQYVEETSDGSIKVDIFYNSTLYTDSDMLMAMSQGNCEMGVAGSDKAGVYVPAINCLSMGYLFESKEHLLDVFASDIGATFNEQLIDAIGVRWAGMYYNGARTVNLIMDKEVLSPEDLKGVQLRMPNSSAFINLGRAMGCSPVAMDMSEVYSALQNGTVDGQDNPLPTIVANKYNEVTKSITLTNHIISENSVFLAEAFYQSLSDEQRQIVDDGIKLLCDTVTNMVADQESSCADELRAAGIKIYEPDITEMRNAVIAWYYDNPESMEGWDLEILDKIINFNK